MSGENIKTACNQNMTLVGAINDDTMTVGYRNSITAANSGDQTATLTTKALGACPMAGTIVDVILTHGENAQDSNPLSGELEVFKDATTVLATKAKLDKTAGTGIEKAYVGATGTGITAPILHGTTANITVAVGDILTYTWTLIRTASPTDEIADVCVTVVIEQETTDVVASQENKEQNVGEVFDFTSFHLWLPKLKRRLRLLNFKEDLWFKVQSLETEP